MTTEPMTLVERLRNPAWVHSHIPVSANADLDKDQTLADLKEAAAEIDRLRAVLAQCAAPYLSPPGTVAEAAAHVAFEFQRRLDLAASALASK